MTCWAAAAAVMTVTTTVMATVMTVMAMAIRLPARTMAIDTDRNPIQNRGRVIMKVQDIVWTILMVRVTGWDGQTWKTMMVTAASSADQTDVVDLKSVRAGSIPVRKDTMKA